MKPLCDAIHKQIVTGANLSSDIRVHLETCAVCHDFLVHCELVDGGMGDILTMDEALVPADFTDRVMVQIRNERRSIDAWPPGIRRLTDSMEAMLNRPAVIYAGLGIGSLAAVNLFRFIFFVLIPA